MDFAASLFLGVLAGWLVSLWQRAATNEEIMVDMAIGAAGGVILAQLLGNESVFDSSLAGILGALIALGMLFVVRRFTRRS